MLCKNKRLRYIDIVGRFDVIQTSDSVSNQPQFFQELWRNSYYLSGAKEFLRHVLPTITDSNHEEILRNVDMAFYNYVSHRYVSKNFINYIYESYLNVDLRSDSGSPITNMGVNDFDKFLYKELPQYFNYNDSMKFGSVRGRINNFVKPSNMVKYAMQKIQLSILMKYSDKWLKIFDAMNTNYSPLDNYNMVEHEEYNEAENVKTSHNVDETSKISHNVDATSKTSHNVDETSKTSHNIDVDSEVLNNDTTNKINGFNSATASPTNETHSESKENQKALAEDNYDETTKTAEALNNYDETRNTAEALNNYDETRNTADALDNYDNVERSKDKDDNFRDLTRHGNIGVTTSQQMLESEIDLRNNYNFWKIVFNDISNEMFLQTY